MKSCVPLTDGNEIDEAPSPVVDDTEGRRLAYLLDAMRGSDHCRVESAWYAYQQMMLRRLNAD